MVAKKMKSREVGNRMTEENILVVVELVRT